MVKPLDEFGGWLRFFQIICYLNIIFSITVMLMSLEMLLQEGQFINHLLALAQLSLITFFLIRIVRIVTLRNPQTAALISDYLYRMFLVAVGYFLLNTLITMIKNNWTWSLENTQALAAALQTMLWCAIWRTYFARSRRVKAYYHLEKPSHQMPPE